MFRGGFSAALNRRGFSAALGIQCCPQPRFDCPSVLRCAAGMLLGVNSLGAVADGLGRRRGFLLSALVLGAAGLASALAPSFAVRCCGCKCDVVPKD